MPFVGLNSTTQITGYLPPSEPSYVIGKPSAQLSNGFHHARIARQRRPEFQAD